MPLPDLPYGIEKKCNDQMAAFLVTLKPVQDAYMGQYRSYLQLLPSHLTPPSGGNEVAPSALGRKPTDRRHGWERVSVPAKTMISLTVNYYGGPNGQGYELVGEIDLAGRVWRRTVNVGPETWRGHDWQAVLPDMGVLVRISPVVWLTGHKWQLLAAGAALVGAAVAAYMLLR